jgi:hypothetical protein
MDNLRYSNEKVYYGWFSKKQFEISNKCFEYSINKVIQMNEKIEYVYVTEVSENPNNKGDIFDDSIYYGEIGDYISTIKPNHNDKNKYVNPNEIRIEGV